MEEDSIIFNRFKGFLLTPSKIIQENIHSNWLFILGGLRAHKESNVKLNSYGVIHIIRQIDGYYSFAPTKELSRLCERLGIETGKLWNSRTRKKVNLLLKENGINDSAQIEHLNGGVKRLVQKLSDQEWTGSMEQELQRIKEIHSKHTMCCYKLKKMEKYINEKTDISKIE